MNLTFRSFLSLPIMLMLNAQQTLANTSEVIIVKGTKEHKTLNQSQESLVVVQKNSIKAPSASVGLEALQTEANISVNKEDETFSIRGVKNTGVTGYQKDNLASILIDRVFQTDLAIKSGSFNLYDLESLEILRGSQSLGQGINSLAGSLNLFHSDPSFDSTGSVRAEVGNAGKKVLQFKQNVPLIHEKLSAKISGTAQNYDGHITNVTTGKKDWAKKDQYNLNTDFIFYPNDTDQIKFGVKAFQSIHGGNYVHGPNQKKYEVYEDLNSTYRTKNAQSYLEYEKTLSENWSNLAILSYSNSKQITSSDSDLTNLNRTGERVDKHRDNFLGFENLLSFKNDKIKNTLGLHAHRYSLIDNYDFNVLPITNNSVNLNIKQYVDRKRQAYSIFDSFNIDLSEQHSMGLGGRFEIVNNRYLTNVSGSRVGTSGSSGTDTYLDNYVRARSGAYGGENEKGKFLPKASYLYHFSREVNQEKNLGFSYSEGYRTGGVSINRFRTKAINYDPETTQNYELSFKSRWENLNFTTNIFYTHWRKQQIQISLSSDMYDTQVENASKSEFFGLETESLLQLSATQEINWNIGVVKSQFLDFKSGTKNYTGNDFPNAPRVTSTLTHRYSFIDTYKLKTTVKYLGQNFADAENSKRINEQYYLDMGLEKTFSHLILELSLKNILNKKYQINRFTNSYGTYSQMSTPREVSLAATYNW